MARPRNIVKTVLITISTTDAVRDYLEELTATGLFGKNAAETADRLLKRAIEDQVRAGTVRKQVRRSKVR